jgi:hypothetical protein
MTTRKTTSANRAQRDAHLKWQPLSLMRTSDVAQRQLNQSRVDYLIANFDPEDFGTPTVSERDGFGWVMDGQHRIAAAKVSLGEDQMVQCWTYTGLTEEDEAERFLKLNNTLHVSAHSRFRVAVTANRARETDIDRVVRANGLVVSQDKIDGAVGAVGTLGRVYDRGGAKTLGRTLRIVHSAYGDSGLEAPVIDGIGLVCQRYNGSLDDDVAIERLASSAGGVVNLLARAETIRRQTGNAKSHAVAAAAVEVINRGRGGKKLPDWFHTEAR